MSDQLKNISEEADPFQNSETIVSSMTPQERRNPHIINQKRRERIASGSGTTLQDVNQLLKQFERMCKLMKQVQKPGSNFFAKLPGFSKR